MEKGNSETRQLKQDNSEKDTSDKKLKIVKNEKGAINKGQREHLTNYKSGKEKTGNW